MPYDINGTFSRNYDFETDRINGIKIMSDRVDAEFDNYATALNQALLRTGEAPMAANLRMGSFSLTGLGDGTVANPSVTFTNDASSGLYRIGSNQIGMAIAGVLRAQWDSTGVTGVLNAKGAGAPLTVNSTSGIGSKIILQDNGVTRSKIGTDTNWPLQFLDAAGTIKGGYADDGATRSWNFYADAISVSQNGTVADTTVNFSNSNFYTLMYFRDKFGAQDALIRGNSAASGGIGLGMQGRSGIILGTFVNQVIATVDDTGLTMAAGSKVKLGDNSIWRSDGTALYTGAIGADVSIYSPSTGIHKFKDSSAADKVTLSNTGDVDAKGAFRNTFGNVTAPGASANAYMWRDAVGGNSLQGSGSSYDASLVNNAGNRVIGVNTGVYKAEYKGNLGASAQNSGEIGWRDIPAQSKTATYSIGLNDRGSLIPITTGGVTIPDNSSIAFPVGSIISLYNDSGSNQTISMLGTDTLRLGGTASTGSRTLAQRGLANLVKVKTTEWIASGAGVS